ncbi:MAG TPA: TIGR03435 family protein, partial [Terracidiphilus sp.]
MRRIAQRILFLALVPMLFAQASSSTATPAEVAADNPASAAAKTQVDFEIADVHPSPPRRYPFFQRGFLENGRYILRQATMVDLIRTAYGLKDSSDVHDGPSWLEWDRWDVIGKVPAGTTEPEAKEMLKSLLQKRFKLQVQRGESEMPAYWLTVAPGGVKMKTGSSGTGDGACHGSPISIPKPGEVPLMTFSCTNQSMAALAQMLTNNGGVGYLQHPVVDKTGLRGAYDFDLKYTPMFLLSHANGEGVTIFDALQKQLGLKLELKTAPEPGLVVESVNETPSPNSNEVARLLPPLPPAQFEVAVIKPSAPDEKPMGRIAGDEVNVRGFPLKRLITIAWDLDPNDKG